MKNDAVENEPPLPSQDGIRFAHIPGFAGYCVSDDGRVFSCRRISGRLRQVRFRNDWRQLKPGRIKHGYRFVMIRERADDKPRIRLVHRLVLECFVGECPNGMEGCHGDGNTQNNRVANLRWGTRLENMQDFKRHRRERMGGS